METIYTFIISLQYKQIQISNQWNIQMWDLILLRKHFYKAEMRKGLFSDKTTFSTKTRSNIPCSKFENFCGEYT